MYIAIALAVIAVFISTVSFGAHTNVLYEEPGIRLA